MIVGVAIKNENDEVMIKLPKPNRHCHCFEHAEKIGIDAMKIGLGCRDGSNQGFYTHTGRYLNRKEAYKYVKRIKQETTGPIRAYLFSEDLW